jgi:hypothetical protein
MPIKPICSFLIMLASALALAVAMHVPNVTHASVPEQRATVTPTPLPRKRLAVQLKSINQNSADGGGVNTKDIDGEVKLPPNGPLNDAWLQFVPKDKTKDIVKRNNGKLQVRYSFRRGNADGEEIYTHAENNAPYCPFQDRDGKCNPLPVVDGEFRLPKNNRKLESGQYFVQVIADADDLGLHIYNVTFNIDYITIVEVDLPPMTGSAAITSPANNAVLKGIVNIRGTANSSNFAYYKFEFEDERCEGGVCFVADARRPVTRNVLLRWDTRTIPNGTYLMRLVVVDKFGRTLAQVPRITVTIRN